MTYSENIGSDLIQRPLTRRQLLRLAGISSLAMGLGACQTSQSAPAVQTSDPVTIRYATGGGNPPAEIQIAIFSEAMQKTVLQQYDKAYSVELILTKGTPEAQTLLVSGQADLATLAFSTIATTVSKNAVPGGIAVVAAQYVDGQPGYGTNAYLVRDDGSIQTAADLKGKTLGVNAIGSAVDIILRTYLRKNGLDPNTDVKFAEISFGAMGAALREERIDLASLIHPFLAVEQGQGGVKALFLSTDAVKPYSAIATVARNKFLQERPQAVRAFLDDWVRGLEWLMAEQNRQQALQIMSDISKTPVETLDKFYGKQGIDYYRHPAACPNAQALQVGVDAMVTEGFLDQRVEIAPLINTIYLPKPCE